MDVRQLVIEAMTARERHDVDGFLELFHPDCEIVFPGVTLRGVTEWRSFQLMHMTAFPDGAYDVQRIEPVGEMVFVEGVWSGTHTGLLATPDGELPPTGRRVSIQFALVITVRDGRMARVRNYHDRLHFLAQLGVAPAAQAA
jgi:uncharacterized protein (TIGR02246 family)